MKEKTKKRNIAEILNTFIDARIKKMVPELVKEEVKAQMILLNELETLANKLEPEPIQESISMSEMMNNDVDDVVDNGLNIKTGNPALDAVLKTTKGGIPQTPNAGSIQEGYRNLMGNEVFTSNDMGLMPSVQKNNGMSVNSMAGLNNRKINPDTPMGKAIDKALTRDYSELVKKFKK